MIITLSGLPGTGTSTVATIIKERSGMDFISSGEIFRGLAKEMNLSLAEFGVLAETDPSVDLKIDVRQQELSKTRDNLILEGRLAGHMSAAAPPGKTVLRVCLKAPIETRVRRIMTREGTSSFKFEMDKTIERENSENTRYQKYYKININDLSVYDLVIDTDRLLPETIADIIMTAANAMK
ncbi:Cytidylate kinase [Methanosarcinaceae archaeon Ag5]|uniref:Cytidylate kinase n=1 Tax=Methanolapillus africanus TaxID=3028297 RepID=A0AAE4SDM2_9EURY|nr:Cytidylate kinase [Methanosarcinaceae archaeon Ag5]